MGGGGTLFNPLQGLKQKPSVLWKQEVEGLGVCFRKPELAHP